MINEIIKILLSIFLVTGNIPANAINISDDIVKNSTNAFIVGYSISPENGGSVEISVDDDNSQEASKDNSQEASNIATEKDNQITAVDIDSTDTGIDTDKATKINVDSFINVKVTASENMIIKTNSIAVKKETILADQSSLNSESSNSKEEISVVPEFSKDNKTASFTFKMPDSDVVIYASFDKEKSEPENTTSSAPAISNIQKFNADDTNYVSFQSVSSFTVETSQFWTNMFYVCGDDESWTSWDGEEIASKYSNKEGKHSIKFRGEGNTNVSGNETGSSPWTINGDSDLECYGNIETLLDHDTVSKKSHPEMNESCFANMFEDCTILTKTPDLNGTTLSTRCYDSMFAGCTKLYYAPQLPATTMKPFCYASMFADCSILDSPPALLAGNGGTDSLADSCYSQMFLNCTSLTSPPVLAATVLAQSCYSSMFEGCVSILECPDLPAKKLIQSCYCNMFKGCTSIESPSDLSFVEQVEVESCSSMFEDCTSLAVYSTPTGIYSKEWRVSSSNEVDDWSRDMFKGTSGDFTGSVVMHKTYYVYNQDPNLITFESVNKFSIQASRGWDGKIFYSFDNSKWTEWDGSKIESEKAGVTSKQVIFVKGQSNNTITSKVGPLASNSWQITGSKIFIKGDLNGLLDYDTVKEGRVPNMGTDAFAYIFANNASIIEGPDFTRETLTEGCYRNMYENCTSLIKTPYIASEYLAPHCFEETYAGCTTLLRTGNLDSIHLSPYCYKGMYKGCTGLEISPYLVATTLPAGCYEEMFMGCTNITAPSLLNDVTSVDTDCCTRMYKDCVDLTFLTVARPSFNNQWNAPSANFAGVWSENMFEGTQTDCPTPLLNERYFIKAVYEEFVTFQSDTQFTLTADYNWNGKVLWSTDLVQWNEITSPVTSKATRKHAKEYLFVRGVDNTVITGEKSEGWKIESPENNLVYCRGNALTMVDYNKVKTEMAGPTLGDYCFHNLFKDNTLLASSPMLPTFNLANNCYQGMFMGCSNLKSFPELYAYNLKPYCYASMFEGCSLLTKYPITDKFYTADHCCSNMFAKCDNLTNIDKIDTYDMSPYCFSGMFSYCCNIKNIFNFSADTLATGCFDSTYKGCDSINEVHLPKYNELADSCYKSMFKDCTNLLYLDGIDYKTLKPSCFESMFQGCVQLVSVPTLNPDTLAESCYKSMFEGCVSLRDCSASYLKTNTLPEHCCDSMFKNCIGYMYSPIDLSGVENVGVGCCNSMYEGCEKIKVYTRASEFYENTWVATNANSSEIEWSTNMFKNTGGEFTGSPSLKASYYVLSRQKNYISFSSSGNFSIKVFNPDKYWDGKLYYSWDNETWIEWDGNEINAYKFDDTMFHIYFKGYNNTKFAFHGPNSRWVIGTGQWTDVYCNGNLETICDADNYTSGKEAVITSGAFSNLFSENPSLVTAPDLPSVRNVPSYAYSWMFLNCKRLGKTPTLSSSSLGSGSCVSMFEGCDTISSPSDISHVVSIEKDACYKMYFNCPNLSISDTKESEYVTEWKATICKNPTKDWSEKMFGATKSLTDSIIIEPVAGVTYYSTKGRIDNWISFSGANYYEVTINRNVKTWDGELYYSTDTQNWKKLNPSDKIKSRKCEDGFHHVYFAGIGNTVLSDKNSETSLFAFGNYPSDANIILSGNTESLLDCKKVTSGEHPVMGEYCFNSIFKINKSIEKSVVLSTPEFKSEKLSLGCYKSMFEGCYSLTESSILNSTNLAESCYESMFKGCTNLTNLPELKATQLATGCYKSMFEDCSSATKACDLPATELANCCYENMFSGTTFWNTPTLRAKDLKEGCYRGMFKNSKISTVNTCQIESTEYECCSEMFYGCNALISVRQDLFACKTISKYAFTYMFANSEIFSEPPTISAEIVEEGGCAYMFDSTAISYPPALNPTNLNIEAYSHMFVDCQNLLTTPELPCKELTEKCYEYMFAGCTKLSIPADISKVTKLDSFCCQGMYQDCEKIKVYDTTHESSTYWRTPSCTLVDNWSLDIFTGTSGEVMSDLEVNKTYCLDVQLLNAYQYADGCLQFAYKPDDDTGKHGRQMFTWFGNEFINKSFLDKPAPWALSTTDFVKSVEVKDELTSSTFAGWFEGLPYLQSFNGSNIKNSITKDTTRMFNNCENLNYVDITNINSSLIQNASDMWGKCNKLQTILVGYEWSFANSDLHFPARVEDDYYWPKWIITDSSDPEYIGKEYDQSSTSWPNNIMATYTWKEKPKPLVSFFEFDPTPTVFNNDGQDAKIKIKDEYKDKLGEIKSISYYEETTGEKVDGSPKNVGTYIVKVTGDKGTYYHPYVELSDPSWKMTITEAEMSADTCQITGIEDSYVFEDKFITPDFSVYNNVLGYGLTKDVDYIFEFENNYHATYGGIYPKVTVTGINNYKGEIFKEFNIEKAINTISDFKCDNIQYGETPSPSAKSKFGEVKFLYSIYRQTDFKPWDVSNQPGRYFAKAYVNGSEMFDYDYSEQVLEFYVIGEQIDVEVIQAQGLSYDGNAHELGKINVKSPFSGYEIWYKERQDEEYYTQEMISKTNAGTYTVYFKVTAPGYSPHEDSFTCTIDQIEVTVNNIKGIDREYDKTCNIECDVSKAKIVGLLPKDVAVVNVDYAKGLVSSPDACQSEEETKVVHITNIALKGDNSENYICSNVEQATVRITKKQSTLKLKPQTQTYYVGAKNQFSCIYEADDKFEGQFEASSSSESVATAQLIWDETNPIVEVNPLTQGSTTITVTLSEGKNYLGCQASHAANVKAGSMLVKEVLPQTDLEYNKEEQELGHVEVLNEGILPTIKYRIGDSGEYKEGTPKAIDANSYRVFYLITCTDYDDVTGEFTTWINKADNKFTSFDIPEVHYSETPAPSATPVFGEKEDVQYTYSTSKDGEYKPWSTTNLPNTYYVKAHLTGDSNYSDAEQILQFELLPLSFKNVKIDKPESAKYTGSPVNLGKVTTSTDGASILYKVGDDPSTSFAPDLPTATEVGMYKIYYRIDKTGYEPIHDYFYSAINKAYNDFSKLECEDVKYSEDPQPEAETLFGDPSTITFKYSTSQTGPFGDWDKTNPVGTYWLKAKQNGTESYYEIDQIISFEVVPNEIKVETHVPENIPYNGQEQELGTITTTPQDSDIEYANPTSEYTHNIEKGKDAGYYLVYYKAEHDNYNTYESAFVSTIVQAENEISDVVCGDIKYKQQPTPSATAKFGDVEYLYSDEEEGEYKEWNEDNPVGKYWVKAFVRETSNYTYVESKASFTVDKATPVLDVQDSATYEYSVPSSFDTKYNGDGTLSVVSSNPDIIEVKLNGTVVELNAKKADSEATITVSATEGDNYTAATKVQKATTSRKESYVVTFQTNGGSLIEPVAVKYNTPVDRPQNPTFRGKTFDDWYVDEACSEKYDFSSPVVKDITLYAKWNVGEIVVQSDEDIIVDADGMKKALNSVIDKNPQAETIVLEMDFVKWQPSVLDKITLDINLVDKRYFSHQVTLSVSVDGEELRDYGSENDTIIPITYNLDLHNKNEIGACRVHSGIFKRLNSQPNADNEYATINAAQNEVKVFASKFSTYAFDYSLVQDNPDSSANSGDDQMVYFIIGGMILFSLSYLSIAMHRKRKNQKTCNNLPV